MKPLFVKVSFTFTSPLWQASISKYAQEIMDKYLNNPIYGDRVRVFRAETGECINRKLKIPDHLANVPFSISTKNARITFKRLLKEADIKDMFLTRKMMGWSNSRFIEDAYDRFTEKDFLDATNSFDEYLDKNLKVVELTEGASK